MLMFIIFFIFICLIITLNVLFKTYDPMLHCELYINEGCTHVDGMLCKYPKCTMRQDYLKSFGDSDLK